jgi:protein tyrosine/serine phosphatase
LIQKRSFRPLAAAIILMVSLGVSDRATAGPGGPPAPIAIENFGVVNPNYYRGAQPKGRDYADLATLGVKSVINLTSDDADADEEAMVKRAGMHYYVIPMTTSDAPRPAQVAEFLTIVNEPTNRPVFVHCVGGRHRTGVMTAVYRMTQDGWTAAEAFKEMKTYRFGADFLHAELKRFVYDYYGQLVHPSSPATIAVAVPASSNRF